MTEILATLPQSPSLGLQILDNQYIYHLAQLFNATKIISRTTIAIFESTTYQIAIAGSKPKLPSTFCAGKACID
jgi:hypothetical protein